MRGYLFRSRVALLTVAWLAIQGAWAGSPVQAQEVDGLAAAAAIEKAMIQAIASAEKSVVAIARLGPRDQLGQGQQIGVGPFGIVRQADEIDPTNPNFVPNEFATGVIIDASGLILTCAHAVYLD